MEQLWEQVHRCAATNRWILSSSQIPTLHPLNSNSPSSGPGNHCSTVPPNGVFRNGNGKIVVFVLLWFVCLTTSRLICALVSMYQIIIPSQAKCWSIYTAFWKYELFLLLWGIYEHRFKNTESLLLILLCTDPRVLDTAGWQRNPTCDFSEDLSCRFFMATLWLYTLTRMCSRALVSPHALAILWGFWKQTSRGVCSGAT